MRIFQYAYTSPDIEATARAWTETLGVGPWTVRGPFTAPDATYQGEPFRASLTVARTFDGPVMIELIQQHDDHPSIFRDAVRSRGHGFHHVAITSPPDQFDERAAGLVAVGGPATFEDVLPSGARVAFFPGAPGSAGLIELVELTPAQAAALEDLRAVCAGWDGTDPWRTA